MCTQNQAIAILREVCQSCQTVFSGSVADAYLYGSYARGDYDQESDVDVLLTVAMDSSEIAVYRAAVADIASELSLRHDVTVSVTVKPLDQFLRYADVLPFYGNVLREGIRYAG